MTTLTAAPTRRYRYHRGRWTRWSGRRWAAAAYAVHPERLEQRRDWATYPVLDDAQRERLLEKAVDAEVLPSRPLAASTP